MPSKRQPAASAAARPVFMLPSGARTLRAVRISRTLTQVVGRAIIRSVSSEHLTLTGTHVRLEPFSRAHVPGLVLAAREDPALYQWTVLPLETQGMTGYVDTAVRWREEGTALPFATVRRADGRVLGSTRFFLIERWE